MACQKVYIEILPCQCQVLMPMFWISNHMEPACQTLSSMTGQDYFQYFFIFFKSFGQLQLAYYFQVGLNIISTYFQILWNTFISWFVDSSQSVPNTYLTSIVIYFPESFKVFAKFAKFKNTSRNFHWVLITILIYFNTFGHNSAMVIQCRATELVSRQNSKHVCLSENKDDSDIDWINYTLIHDCSIASVKLRANMNRLKWWLARGHGNQPFVSTTGGHHRVTHHLVIMI